jgi:hypothetical protein
MKVAFSWCVLGFMALGHVTSARAEGSSGDTEKAIAALEQQWAQAERENKAELIAPLLAEKFMITESAAQVLDRAAFLAEERSEQYSSSDISDLNVKVFGETVIARYVLSQKYTNKGKAWPRTHRLSKRPRPIRSGREPPSSKAALCARNRGE